MVMESKGEIPNDPHYMNLVKMSSSKERDSDEDTLAGEGNQNLSTSLSQMVAPSNRNEEILGLEDIPSEGLSLVLNIPLPSPSSDNLPPHRVVYLTDPNSINRVKDSLENMDHIADLASNVLSCQENGNMDTLPWEQRIPTEKDWDSSREMDRQDETDKEENISKKKIEKNKQWKTPSGISTRSRVKENCGAVKNSRGKKSSKKKRELNSF